MSDVDQQPQDGLDLLEQIGACVLIVFFIYVALEAAV